MDTITTLGDALQGTLQDQLDDALSALTGGHTQHTRLLRLHTPLGANVLLAERFKGTESIGPAVDGSGFRFEITAVSADGHLELKGLIGQAVLLELLTQDGSCRPFHGHVTAFALEGSDGSLSRYRLVVQPWLAFLQHRVDSFVFQDLTVMEIVEAVFADYAGQGKLAPAWRWALADDAGDENKYVRRSLTIQYQESDLAFVERLLAEEGLFYWFEHTGDRDADALGAHNLVIADRNGAFPSGPQASIRFHRAAATEKSDSIQRFERARAVSTTELARRSWNYRGATLAVVSDAVNAPAPNARETKPETVCAALIDIDPCGPYQWETSAQGARLAANHARALASAAHRYAVRGTVRTLAPARTFELTGHHAVGARDADTEFVCVRVEHHARSNLNKSTRELNNATEEPLYAHHALVLPLRVPYQALARDEHGARRHPKPTVIGAQTAIVVGLQGPVHTDRDHRIKIQFHWQRGAQSSHRLGHASGENNAPASDGSGTWVRVLTPMGGANWGGHFVPRLGQEVLVEFIAGDIDRPVVVGAVYNGVGQEDAQGNGIGGGAAASTGNVPAFFPGTKTSGRLQGHAHTAVLVGIKTQALAASQSGFGAFNALVFDNTPGCARAWLGSTQAATSLVAGHLIHQNDNQRLQPRGYGVDLTTQAYGALRAGSGVLISTDARPGLAGTQMDSREAQSQLTTALELGKTLADTAQKHNAKLPGEPAPDQLAWQQRGRATVKSITATEARGAVHGSTNPNEEAAFVATAGGTGTIVSYARPDLIVSGSAGIGLFTPASQATIAGQTLAWIARQDINLSGARNAAMAVEKGLVLFTYGKAANPNKANTETGIRLHAASGSVIARAVSDQARFTADKAIDVASVTAGITITAPTSSVLAIGGGSYLKIEGANIELGTSGTARFEAAMKNLTSGANASGTASVTKPGQMRDCSSKNQVAAAAGAGSL